MTAVLPACCQRLLAVVLLMVSGVVCAGESARALMDKMSRSFRELNYQGAFSFQQGDNIESLRMAHAVIDGQEYERLEHMDGDKREIIRRGHSLTCIHPGHQLIRFYQQQQSLKYSPVDQESIDQYYQFKVTDSGRIAGRDVINMQISPRDTHRFGYRLSLDKETGLLLRSELQGPKGAILERFQFVDIVIGGPIELEYFTGADHSYHAEHAPPEVSTNKALSRPERSWTVKWLPGGFTAAVANLTVTSDDMATFTDGLTVFSVFLEREIDPDTMAKGVEGRAQRGATIAYSRALLLAGHPHRVTVVGEIPAQTAQQVAQSVVLADQR